MQMQIIIEKFLRSEKSHVYKLNVFQRMLLTILSSYMGKKNHAFPSYLSLLRDTGIGSKTTLNKSIRKLEHLGLLLVERKHKRNNEYAFTNELIHMCLDIIQHEHSKLSPHEYTSSKKRPHLSPNEYTHDTPITKRLNNIKYPAYKMYKSVENPNIFHNSEAARVGLATCFNILGKKIAQINYRI